jgi:alanyl-tRNA synthetase
LTEKLYYENSRLFEFTARVLSFKRDKARWRLLLDRTAFYPEAGGQPADRGWINDIPVSAVRAEGEEVIHFLEQDPGSLAAGDEIRGRIDAGWRLDYMQQHTGQHIISACLVRQGAYPTVSIHMGESTTTVEVDAPAVPEADLTAVEEAANRAVCRNLPVRTRWVGRRELAELKLRRPPTDRERLRLVEIDETDLCACGGTHLSSTGEVGLIKAVGMEKIRGRVRLYWKIGRRAYEDYRGKDKLAGNLSRLLSSSTEEIPAHVEGLLSRLQQQTRDNAVLEKRLAAELAAALAADAERRGNLRLISSGFEEEAQTLVRQLCETLLKGSGNVVCLTNSCGGRLQWLAGVSEDVDLDLAAVLKPLFPLIEARGGGKGKLWQGSGNKPAGQDAFRKGWLEKTGRLLPPQA